MTKKSQKSKSSKASKKSRVLALVLQYEEQMAAVAAAAAAEAQKKGAKASTTDKVAQVLAGLTEREEPPVNLSDERYAPRTALARGGSGRPGTNNRLAVGRPSKSRNSGRNTGRKGGGSTRRRDLMKQVQEHFYSGEPSEATRAWVLKILEEVFQLKRNVVNEVTKPEISTPEEADGPGSQVALGSNTSDQFGDDSGVQQQQQQASLAQAEESTSTPSPTMTPSGAQNFDQLEDALSSGDATVEIPSKDDGPEEEEGETEEDEAISYRLFCEQIRAILSSVAGFPVTSLPGFGLSDFRDIQARYGLTRARQMLTGYRLVYEPQVLVLRHQTAVSEKATLEAILRQTGNPPSGEAGFAGMQKMILTTEDAYFYPNKLTFK